MKARTSYGYVTYLITALSLFFVVLGQAMAGTIVGTKHDFSTKGWNTDAQICVVCHTPHNGDTTEAEAPLWNHDDTLETNFAMYERGTLDATADTQPTGISKLCLSCHDGTIAIDSFGGATGTEFMTGNKAVGRNADLSDDHPISITFDAALSVTDQGLHNPVTKAVEIGTGGDKTRSGTVDTLMLSSNKVQCSSCHDVHNNFVADNGTGGGFPFLKVTKNESKLCLTCHNK
jgi:hypothetical protein